MLFTPLVGLLVGKVDSRYLIGPGMILIAVASLMMGNFNLDISSHDFFWPNFVQGMGMALTMVPLMTVALATIRNQQMGNATGLYALGAQSHPGSIGIAVAIAMVLARRAAASGLSDGASDSLRSALSKCDASGTSRR